MSYSNLATDSSPSGKVPLILQCYLFKESFQIHVRRDPFPLFLVSISALGHSTMVVLVACHGDFSLCQVGAVRFEVQH